MMPIARSRSAKRPAMPDSRQFEAAESLALSLFAEEKANPAGGGVLLRQAIGDLGQRLRRRDSDRDQNLVASPNRVIHHTVSHSVGSPGRQPPPNRHNSEC